LARTRSVRVFELSAATLPESVYTGREETTAELYVPQIVKYCVPSAVTSVLSAAIAVSSGIARATALQEAGSLRLVSGEAGLEKRLMAVSLRLALVRKS
jgi:hypothetical protein